MHLERCWEGPSGASRRFLVSELAKASGRSADRLGPAMEVSPGPYSRVFIAPSIVANVNTEQMNEVMRTSATGKDSGVPRRQCSPLQEGRTHPSGFSKHLWIRVPGQGSAEEEGGELT